MKVKISKILLPVDGSESSLRAVEYALGIAKNNDAQIVAVTILDMTSLFIAIPQDTRNQISAIGKRDALKIFAEVKDMAEHEGINIKTEIIESPVSAAETIIRYAKKHGIDLIVIGTKGRSGVSKILLGSVASKVVTHAPCPVFVVR